MLAQDASATWYPERRLALVIGNSNYSAQGTIWPDLEGGPLKDADAIAALLRTLGFEVILAKDEDLDQMNASLRQLSRRIRAAPTHWRSCITPGTERKRPARRARMARTTT